MIIEYYKVYDMNEDKEYKPVASELHNREDYEDVVSKPWEIECWAEEFEPNVFRTFCYLDLDGIDSVEKALALAEAKLNRRTLAYVAEKVDAYASVFQRMEAMIWKTVN